MRGWRFKLLRWRYAMWVAWDCDPAIVAVRNFVFWIRRPVLWCRVQYELPVYRRAFREGKEVIQA